jgi:hypothetical protein
MGEYMTVATTATEGQIVLSGDLTGTGEAPALRATGVTPGTYSFHYTNYDSMTIPQVVIDSKGRVIFAKSAPAGPIDKTSASQYGVAKIGTNINDVDGLISCNAFTLTDATTTELGIARVDNSSLGIVDGEIRPLIADTPYAGLVKTGVNITNTGGAISVPLATTSAVGRIKPNTDGLTMSGGTLSASNASTTQRGIFKIDGSTIVNTVGVLSVPNVASTTVAGLVKVDTNTIGLSNGIISVGKTATSAVLGVLRPDNTTVTVDGSGILTNLFYSRIATDTVAGLVIPSSSNFTIDVSNVLSANTATSAALGVVKPDGTTVTASAGVLSYIVPTATNAVLGKIRPDNTTTTIASGVLSVPTATNAVLGKIRPDNTTTTIASGVLSIPLATTASPGVARPDNTTITLVSGALTAVQPSIATSTTPGKVKCGVTLDITAQGVISIPLAPIIFISEMTGTNGVVKPDNSTITISDGVLSAAKATSTTNGVVKTEGTLLKTTAGVISVQKATYSEFGIVIGNSPGIVNAGGVLSTAIADVNTANTFTKCQHYNVLPGIFTPVSGIYNIPSSKLGSILLSATDDVDLTLSGVSVPSGTILSCTMILKNDYAKSFHFEPTWFYPETNITNVVGGALYRVELTIFEKSGTAFGIIHSTGQITL